MRLVITLVGLLASLQACVAQVDMYANFGGLYFCPASKDLIYVEWDHTEGQHNAHAVYWSATGQKPRRMQIATQFTESKAAIQNDVYHIKLWEEVRPNVRYICRFIAEPQTGRHSMEMQLDGAARIYKFLLLGNEENGYMDEGDRQHASMNLTLSHLKFHVFNKDTKAYNFETPVLVGVAEDPSVCQIVVGTPDANTTFLASFTNSFDLLAGVQTVDRSKQAYRFQFDLYESTIPLLMMHIYGPDGRYFYSLAEHYADFVSENTY
jgi:hypothetical protein